MAFDMRQWKRELQTGAAAMNIHLDRHQTEQMALHALQLSEWSHKMNLTAVREPGDMLEVHFVDSLIPAEHLPSSGCLLDMGSGAGFPGLPIKIIKPGLSVCLIDASRKKVSFLNHTIRSLALEDIVAHHCRAEEFAGRAHAAASFDVVISRAFSDLRRFVQLALPLTSERGTIVAMKGKFPRSEIDALATLLAARTHQAPHRGTVYSIHIHAYRLPVSDASRTLVRVCQSNAQKNVQPVMISGP